MNLSASMVPSPALLSTSISCRLKHCAVSRLVVPGWWYVAIARAGLCARVRMGACSCADCDALSTGVVAVTVVAAVVDVASVGVGAAVAVVHSGTGQPASVPTL